MRQHDLGPAYYARATDKNGTAIDLTGATIAATMQSSAGGSNIFSSQACTITDAAAGDFEYAWQGTNTATVGEFYIEFQVTPLTGGKYSLPANGRALITIEADLDGA